jgi:hypothetical protein
MAEQTHSADWTAEAPQFGRARLGTQPPPGAQASIGMQALWRLAIWGTLATFALFAAVISAYSSATTPRPTSSSAPSQRPSGQGSPGQLTLSQATPSQAASSQAASGQADSNQAAPNQAASGQTNSSQAGSTQASAGQGTIPARTSAGDFAARPDETAEQVKHLAQAVRALAGDHEQVLARIATLERNLDGVTGSIKRDTSAALQPAAPPSPAQKPPTAALPGGRPDMPAAPTAAAPTPSVAMAAPTPAGPTQEAAGTPAQAPAPQASGSSDATPTAIPDANHALPSSPLVRVATVEPAEAPAEPMVAGGLGVDVGGATNYEGLRTLWHSTLNSDPTLLEQLYPVVAIRENSKTHGVDLRLVVGPLPDTDAAARVCTSLSAAHHYCQSVAFEGQRLSLNDAASSKSVPVPRHRAAGSSPPGRFEPETPHFQAVIGK